MAVVLATLIPLLLATAPSTVSTCCADLLEALNDLRAEGELEKLPRILELELFLKNKNRGQGLGFVVLGVVLDKRMLAKLLLGSFTVALPLAAFLTSSEEIDPDDHKLPVSLTSLDNRLTGLESSLERLRQVESGSLAELLLAVRNATSCACAKP